jgi:hypothetical protein
MIEAQASMPNSYVTLVVLAHHSGRVNSIPLTGTRPQPNYLLRWVQTKRIHRGHQLDKLSPFIGYFIAGHQSLFVATYYMYFPFLTCEVKSGAAALDIADRQNAHSMILAVPGIVELFRAVKSKDEVNRKILASRKDIKYFLPGTQPMFLTSPGSTERTNGRHINSQRTSTTHGKQNILVTNFINSNSHCSLSSRQYAIFPHPSHTPMYNHVPRRTQGQQHPVGTVPNKQAMHSSIVPNTRTLKRCIRGFQARQWKQHCLTAEKEKEKNEKKKIWRRYQCC